MAECRELVYDGTLYLTCRDSGEARVDVYEAAYQALKTGVQIVDREGLRIHWLELIARASQRDPNTWVMFAVYYDLRERGRVLKLGPHPNSFTLYKAGVPRAIVMVLEETRKFPAGLVWEWLEGARRMSRELVLAIVDKHGDVSYYTVERFKPPSRENQGESGPDEGVHSG